jgi:hypothetical protein
MAVIDRDPALRSLAEDNPAIAVSRHAGGHRGEREVLVRGP